MLSSEKHQDFCICIHNYTVAGATGCLTKNENKTEEMIEIMETLHKYVPRSESGLKEVFLGGDQLTCGRVQSAKMAHPQAPDAVQRLEGLLPKVEGWHALQAFYQVIWIALYSTSLSWVKGTLY